MVECNCVSFNNFTEAYIWGSNTVFSCYMLLWLHQNFEGNIVVFTSPQSFWSFDIKVPGKEGIAVGELSPEYMYNVFNKRKQCDL